MASNWTDQPAPIPNYNIPVWELVIEDMRRRDHVGRQRYGTLLQSFNGRDALQDAYEEALDLAVYLRQAIEERKRVRAVTLEAVHYAIRPFVPACGAEVYRVTDSDRTKVTCPDCHQALESIEGEQK